jgi:hypothetical protein
MMVYVAKLAMMLLTFTDALLFVELSLISYVIFSANTVLILPAISLSIATF